VTSARWLPPILWAALILFLTSIPGSRIPDLSFPNMKLLDWMADTMGGTIGTMLATARDRHRVSA
jgi:hypothetical protein